MNGSPLAKTFGCVARKPTRGVCSIAQCMHRRTYAKHWVAAASSTSQLSGAYQLKSRRQVTHHKTPPRSPNTAEGRSDHPTLVPKFHDASGSQEGVSTPHTPSPAHKRTRQKERQPPPPNPWVVAAARAAGVPRLATSPTDELHPPATHHPHNTPSSLTLQSTPPNTPHPLSLSPILSPQTPTCASTNAEASPLPPTDSAPHSALGHAHHAPAAPVMRPPSTPLTAHTTANTTTTTSVGLSPNTHQHAPPSPPSAPPQRILSSHLTRQSHMRPGPAHTAPLSPLLNSRRLSHQATSFLKAVEATSQIAELQTLAPELHKDTPLMLPSDPLFLPPPPAILQLPAPPAHSPPIPPSSHTPVPSHHSIADSPPPTSPDMPPASSPDFLICISACMIQAAHLSAKSSPQSIDTPVARLSRRLAALLRTPSIPPLNTPDACFLLYAMGRTQRYDEELIASALTQLEPLLPTLQPSHMSHLLQGLSHLRHSIPKSFLHSFFSASQPLLDTFTTSELSSTLSAVATLQHHNLVKLGRSSDQWLTAVNAAVNFKAPHMRAYQLAEVAWAAACTSRPVVWEVADSVSGPAFDQLTFFSARDLSRLLLALGKMEYEPEAAFLDALQKQVKLLLPHFEEDTLPDSLWGLAAMGARPNGVWVDAVLLRGHTLLGQMKGPHLAACVWAVSRFRHRPYNAWMFDFFVQCRREMTSMKSQHVVMLVEGITDLGSRPNDETVYHFVAAQRAVLPLLTPEQMTVLVRCWNRLFNPLPGKPLRTLVQEMQRRSQILV